MKLKILIYSICIFFIVLLQSTVLDYVKVFGVKPNLLLVFIVSIALLRGNAEGAAVGFFAGLAQDIVTGKVIGLYSLLGMYLGLMIGSLNKRLYRENFFVAVIFMFLSSVVYEGLVYFFNTFSLNKDHFILVLYSTILPEAGYNSAAMIFMYLLVIRIGYKLEGVERLPHKY